MPSLRSFEIVIRLSEDAMDASSAKIKKGTDDPCENPDQATILEELKRIFEGRSFRNSERGKQFLEYVVRNALEGHSEGLKERIIGTRVFGKPHDYATGEDPAVRVQAGEVRRRLEQYYHERPTGARVQIELPTGSYTPSFRWLPITVQDSVPIMPVPMSKVEDQADSPAAPRGNNWLPWTIAVVSLAVVLICGIYVLSPGLFQARSELDRFWQPGFTSKQPILICVAQLVVYVPRPELVERFSATHPGASLREMSRHNEVLPFSPEEKLQWKELDALDDVGVAMGDVYASARLTRFLDEKGKTSQVRVGRNYTFEDLRTSPSILVGAFNNKWTMELTSNLRFRFADDVSGDGRIYESVPGGREWRPTLNEQHQVVHDFGLVTRLLDSKTGQFTIAIGGIAADGTQAAAELVSNSALFREALRNAPADWEKKNMEIVLETAVTDSVSSPPHVVATYFW